MYSNTADQGGGFMFSDVGGATIERGEIYSNTANAGGGIETSALGGVELLDSFEGPNNPNLRLDNTTLSGNTASRHGGGFYADGRFVALDTVTVAGSRVLVPAETVYDGKDGGLYASGSVGGGSAGLQLHSTLLAYNTDRDQANPPVPDDCYAVSAALYSLGHNLIQANACLIGGTTTGNILGQDPFLGPPQGNGGATLTQAPLRGSPAIDHGDDVNCPAFDQRGWHRPNGSHCDISAGGSWPVSIPAAHSSLSRVVYMTPTARPLAL